MKIAHTLLLLPAVLLLAACGRDAGSSCDNCDCADKPAATTAVSTDAKDSAAPKKHPLKGVVTDVLADQSALMVKHEEIPGFMKAMTMMFTVDPAVLATVKKGDAITGLIHRDADGTWRLDDVKAAPPAP